MLYIATTTVLFYVLEAPTVVYTSRSQVRLRLYIAFQVVFCTCQGYQRAAYSSQNCIYDVLEVPRLFHKSRSQVRLQLHIPFQVVFFVCWRHQHGVYSSQHGMLYVLKVPKQFHKSRSQVGLLEKCETIIFGSCFAGLLACSGWPFCWPQAKT